MKKYFNLLPIAILFLVAGNISAQTSPCDAKDYDCKIKYYQNQIKADPKDTEAYYNLGINFENKGEYAQAVAMFDLYLTIGVTDRAYMADGYYNRGLSQQKLGKDDLAVQDFTKAIGLVPTETMFYVDRGMSYNGLKNFPPAIADFTKAMETKKDDSSLYFARGYAYMEQKDYDKATPDFTKVITLDPKNFEAYYNRGTIRYRLKQYTLALTDLDKYIAMNQASARSMADGYVNRGLAHFFLGNSLKAVDDFTKAIELAPTLKNAYTSRALAYRKLGKVVLAQADEGKAATLEDDGETI